MFKIGEEITVKTDPVKGRNSKRRSVYFGTVSAIYPKFFVLDTGRWKTCFLWNDYKHGLIEVTRAGKAAALRRIASF